MHIHHYIFFFFLQFADKRATDQEAIQWYSKDPDTTIQGPPEANDGHSSGGEEEGDSEAVQRGAIEEDSYAGYAIWEDHSWHGSAANCKSRTCFWAFMLLACLCIAEVGWVSVGRAECSSQAAPSGAGVAAEVPGESGRETSVSAHKREISFRWKNRK